jgi:DNA-binding transcriptional MocR family regulator
MASKHKRVPIVGSQKTPEPVPFLPAAEVRSFLKETRGVPSWNIREMAKSLNISRAEAKRVAALLQAQGYIEPSSPDEWLTTVSGETVSGSKPPRFTPEAIEQALSDLADRIKTVNRQPKSAFHITKAVAFGDLLTGRARVQAADVGIQLIPLGPEVDEPNSARAQAWRRDVFRKLKAKSSGVSPRYYEEWMSSRTHRRLL